MCPLAEVDHEDSDNYVKVLEIIFQNSSPNQDFVGVSKGIQDNSELPDCSKSRTVLRKSFDHAEEPKAEKMPFSFPGQNSTSGSTMAMGKMLWKCEMGREVNRLATDDSSQFPSLSVTMSTS